MIRRNEILKRVFDNVLPITGNIFIQDRPNAVNQMKDFAVIGTVGSMNDRCAYGDTSIKVMFFAKNRSGGIEDTQKLQSMIDKFMERLPMSNDLFTSYPPRVFSGGDDGLGFHYITIIFRVFFKVN